MALDGIKVVEFAGLAPGPFAGLVLALNGASVITIDRPSSTVHNFTRAAKRSLAVDLKTTGGLRVAKQLISKADVLIDPFRPGVLEKLGLGPSVFHAGDEGDGLNDRLVYARLAGFPRDGVHSSMAGHDINYIALSGILSMLPGTSDKPAFPLNIIADFAGGGLLCANGILLALIERFRSGRGQVVNVDMVSGSRFVSSFLLLSAASDRDAFAGPRGTNLLDGGAPFYNVYTCSDGKWMSVGCLEPHFFAQFIAKFNSVMKYSGKQGNWFPSQSTQSTIEDWPKLRQYLEDGFRTQPRDFWTQVFHGTDACTVPVLSPKEAEQLHGPLNPHPDLSRTPPSPLQDKIQSLDLGEHTADTLREFGLSEEEIRQFDNDGALNKDLQERGHLRSKL